ncbi:MAG: ketopantoate reductase family protein, partial [Mogibacterium sp.]|nr:ketopantoate reductase family protein [Mogibacterium sp.]
QYIEILGTLSAEGSPSMAQDRIKKQPSEVEFFAGTVIRYAEKHGIYVPENRFLYDRVKKIEEEY